MSGCHEATVCWIMGANRLKLSAGHKLAANTRLEMFRHTVTSDFIRKPQTIAELNHWKATEFRTFLLYTGCFVLHKIAQYDIFAHFVNLSVAIRIPISDRLSVSSEYGTFAYELLLYFVSQSAAMYGKLEINF